MAITKKTTRQTKIPGNLLMVNMTYNIKADLVLVVLGACIMPLSAVHAQDVINAVGKYKPVAAPAMGINPHYYKGIFWLDNYRVLVGVRPRNFDVPDDVKANADGRERVAIWDTEKNTISISQVRGNPVCVNPNTQYVQIFDITKKDVKASIFTHGKWSGVLEDYIYADFTNKANSRYVNPYSCLDHAGQSNRLVEGQISDPLLEEHGILHFDMSKGVLDKGWFILRLKRPRGETIDFETTRAEFNYSPMFSHVANAYVFLGRLYQKGAVSKEEIEKSKERQDAYSLLSPYPPYEIKIVPIPPYLKRLNGAKVARSFLFPTFVKGGKILWHYLVSEEPERGTYLQEGDKLYKVVDGHQVGAEISPDGCKLAYMYNSGRYMTHDHIPHKSNRLEFIDFCKGE